jgi:hypothetical protein
LRKSHFGVYAENIEKFIGEIYHFFSVPSRVSEVSLHRHQEFIYGYFMQHFVQFDFFYVLLCEKLSGNFAI